MGNLIRATSLLAYDELVHDLGEDPKPLLDRFSIPLSQFRPDRSFIPFRSVAALLEASAKELRCPEFGLRLAEYQGMHILGPISVIARNSQTVEEAILNIARYLYFHCPALDLQLIRGQELDFVLMRLDVTELTLAQNRQAYEVSIGNGKKILKLLAGEDFIPEGIAFKHHQIATNEAYQRAFGCEVKFEQSWCGLKIPLSALGQKLTSTDDQARELAEQFLNANIAHVSDSFSTRVIQLIDSLLPTRNCTNKTIAEHLAIHPRTLQRKLASEGTTYESLLDQERRQLAEQYLSQKDMRLDHITGLLGYSEQAVFNRACRRWFGATPTEYRNSLATLMSGRE
ncbi:hypothetical protein A3758_13735 [Oleiphilus sp. HI0118]|uniref:AraC family transcriptional regulator n=1 Tax=Oleiphilus sp. HI0079 TaxID=1822254 RepID=UPI0007C333A2|nr:AraC family transcriptional regulator [Oleiphilus sp. HI0079]KZZ13774.1 hypothetical protein A3750_02900 [Oleiphilus sp. HI0079]KZZ49906.1 hypothetical protein A3758_13735 [Oleiphilus sp. HI0118]